MAENVKTTFTSDPRQLEKDIERLQRKIVNLEEKLQDGSKASKGWEESTKRFVVNAVAGYASVQTATRLIADEWRSIIEMQNKAGQFQLTEAGAQAPFLRNLGLVSQQEQQAAIQRIRGISTETGVSTTALFQAASTAVSAKGDLTNQQALDAVQQAARVAPESVDELRGVAGGLLDLSAVTGTADAKQNLGFLLQLASLSRVTNLQQLSENVAPAAIGVTQFGDSAAQAASLVATITSTIKDASGAVSGNTAQQLAGQLQEFLPEETTYKRDATGKITGVAAEGTGLTSTTERLAFLRENPELAEAFLQQASFRQKGLPAVKQLIGLSEGPAFDLFERNVGTFGDPATLGANVDEFVGNIQNIPQQRTARIARQLDVATEGVKIANQTGGEAGVIRERLAEILEASGRPAFETRLQGIRFDASTIAGGNQGLDELIRLIRDLINALSNPQQFVGASGPGFSGLVPRETTSQEQAQIQVLQDMLAELRAIKETGQKPQPKLQPAAGEN